MSKTIHVCASVRGMLNWPHAEFKCALKYMKKEDGSLFRSIPELRDALMDELSKGHEVIPMGECEGFDYKTGCPGHENPPDAATAPR